MCDLENMVQQIKQLPEDGATTSRDYGRGYSQAVKDILSILQEEQCQQ